MNAKIATTVQTAEVTLVVATNVMVKGANADSMTVVVTVEVTIVVEEMTVGLMAEVAGIPIKMVATGFVHVVKMIILPEGQNVTDVKQSVQKEWAAMVETVEVETVAEVEISETVVVTDEVATAEETEVAGIPMTETGFVLVVKMTILPEGQNVTGAKPHAQAAVQVEVETVEVATGVEVEISETVVETEVATAEIAETKMVAEIPM